MALFGRKRTTVALDIGSGLIKLVVIDLGAGQPVLRKVAFTSVVDGAIVEGEVMDPGIVADAVRGLLSTAGVKAKKVVTIGLETYLAAGGMHEKEAKLDKQSHHLLLLAENAIGYRNLLSIASAAQLEGFYYFPRIDHEFLAAHAEGLIATTGCLAAEIPRLIHQSGKDAATEKDRLVF